MSHLLKEVQMKALGCLMNLREKHTQNQFKQSFVQLATQLDLDDVGYLYDPNKSNEFFTIPGQLLGEVCNANIPSYHFGVGFSTAIASLSCLDDDYKKTLISVTDSIKNTDVYYIEETLKFNHDVHVFLFVLDKGYFLLENLRFDLLTKKELKSISEVDEFLSKIIL